MPTGMPTSVPTGTSTGGMNLPPPVWDGSAPKGSVPLTGGTLLVLADGKTAAVADPDRDMVSLVSLADQVVKAQIQLPTGSEPGRVVEDAAGQVHVVLRRGGGVADIDVFSGTLLGLRQTCALPRGIGYRASDNTLAVSCLAGDLVTLSANAQKKDVISRVKVTSQGAVVTDLRDVIIKGDSLYLTTFRSAQVLKVQASGEVLGAPLSLNTRVDTSAAQLKAEGLPGGIEQNYVPAAAWRAVAGPTGDIVVVHQAGTDRVINVAHGDEGGVQQQQTTSCTSEGYGGTTCVTEFGKPICTPPVLVGVVSSVSASGEVSDGPPLPNGALPVDIAPSKDGKRYSVVLAGNPGGTSDAKGQPLHNLVRVTAVDTSAGVAANADVFDRDLCALDSTDGVTLTGQPVAVGIDNQGREIVLSRQPSALFIVSGSDITTIPLSGVSVTNDGYDLFHTNTGRGMSCAGCHLEGQDDARTWKFTPGLDADGNPLKVLVRRTQTFRAGFLDTAPFHWDGEFAAIPDLMNDVFVHRMGAAMLPSTERQNSLEGWMNNIPAKIHETPSDAQAQSIANGKAIFNDPTVNCASCHSGAHLTNNKNEEIGFGTATQTPSLIDVSFHAPYLHDGSVTTLEARFTDATALSGKHGKTDKLNPAQLKDLIAYLYSL
jgi:mono/diheme cytochrome c family protein